MLQLRLLLPLLLCFFASAAQAQQIPPLTGRVADHANLLPPADEAALSAKLEALEQATSRQLVVATIPDLQGYPIEDYGYRLGQEWGIGQQKANNGIILIVAPNERRVRIEVGLGMEPIVTDALSGQIIRDQVTPRFKAGDFVGGINAGADALIEQLQAPPEEAEQRILAAQQEQAQQRAAGGGGGGSIFPLIFWGLVLFFIIIPMLRGGRRGHRYRRRGGFPVIIWGPGGGGGGWGGGGFGGGGGGFGGFSGGGGSFGGGGASGSW